jgi:hypothetical protein
MARNANKFKIIGVIAARARAAPIGAAQRSAPTGGHRLKYLIKNQFFEL